jgi:chaperone BCS1
LFVVLFSILTIVVAGLVACEGRLLFFTTNHLEQLDPALMRPGRVDRIVSLRLASPKQIEQLFLRFHPKLDSVARL